MYILYIGERKKELYNTHHNIIRLREGEFPTFSHFILHTLNIINYGSELLLYESKYFLVFIYFKLFLLSFQFLTIFFFSEFVDFENSCDISLQNLFHYL
jgi:hypothetical protein